MSTQQLEVRNNSLAAINDPAKVQALKDGILAAVKARTANKPAASAKPAKVSAPKATAKAKAAAAPQVQKTAPVATGKVIASAKDTDLICVTDTGTGSSLAGVGFELSPMRYNGEWVWSVPGMAEKEVRGNALLHHKGYTLAGRFFAVVRNDQGELAQAVRTRIQSKAAGAATTAKRTKENLEAYRAWVAQNAAARPA